MTKAGYLKAVSVGFMPLKVVTMVDSNEWPCDWHGAAILSGRSREGKKVWDSQMRDLNLSDMARKPATVFLEQQQLELSVCVIGVNPNAIAKSYKAGILTEADIDLISSERSKRETAWLASESAAANQARQRKRKAFMEKFENAIKTI
jgi:hypothetical protein